MRIPARNKCLICDTPLEGERKLCYSRECNLVWQSYSKKQRRKIREQNVEHWQQHLDYQQRYRKSAVITLPGLKFMEGEEKC